ncbi:MAG TPA: ABC transporter ATP-binding protein [Fluviicola sp.]|nr:ABC transporter ATP-binding protein [Fluviicola sp.]
MSKIAISLQNVTKQFDKKIAVNNISLEIPKGQIVTVLGPNGAGKSTTISMMLGILKPTNGTVLLNGKNPQNYQNRQYLGAMLQHIGLPDTLKPLELLELWRSYYSNPFPQQQIVEMAGLSEIVNTRFGELSGGQKRRVAFALAICGNPEVLFLDEPSAGLDIQSRNLLWTEIINFASLKKTVVLCTHYLDEADSLSNRIILMNKGEIMADDTPQNIKAKVGKKTIRFKTQSPIYTFEETPGIENVYEELGYTNIETNSPEFVLRSLFNLDLTITDLEVNSVNLEDAFLTLTKS